MMTKPLFSLFLLLLLSVSLPVARGQDGDAGDQLNVNDLCKDRPDNEYFRLTTKGDCRDVVRCDRAGVSGVIRLASVKCPNRYVQRIGGRGGETGDAILSPFFPSKLNQLGRNLASSLISRNFDISNRECV